jgi:DNA-binding response OmpR family regulator
MKSILLVDDEIFARDNLASIIRRFGFSVTTASTGEEAVKSYRENRPDYVFLDVLLPGIDGEDVFRYIREIDPRAKVYFITGCETIFTRDQALQLGASGYLTKPIRIEQLMALLTSLRETSGPQCPLPSAGI